MSPSRRNTRAKRPRPNRPGPKAASPRGQAAAPRRGRSPREIAFTVAPLLVLLALFIFLNTSPEPAHVRAVFGIFFLAWGVVLIGLGTWQVLPRPAPLPTTPEERTVRRVRASMYIGGGVVFGMVGMLVVLGVINLDVGSRE